MEQVILDYNLKVFLTVLPIFLIAVILTPNTYPDPHELYAEEEYEVRVGISEVITALTGLIMMGNGLIYLLVKVWAS